MRAAVPYLLLGVALSVSCDPSPKVHSAEPPLAHVEVYGGHAVVDLVKGVSVHSIVGADLFADFKPGWTPEEAEARFGKPKEVVREHQDLTLFVYERQGKRVAVVRQTVFPSSGGGPPGTNYYLEAFPPEGFVETLPASLRELIRSEPKLREIGFRSTVLDDWNIHLDVRDGRVSSVEGHEAPPPQMRGQGSADPSPSIPTTSPL